MDLHLLAFFDEQRDADDQARLERGVLRDAAAGGIAADAGLAVGDGHFHDGRKDQADGIAVVLLHLQHQVVGQQQPVFAQRVGAERQRVERASGP